MSKKVIAYDLGTSGVKASLFSEHGDVLAHANIPYKTYYPSGNRHEQKPNDWWTGIAESTRSLLAGKGGTRSDIVSIAISGHSLGMVPLDKHGRVLLEQTPIWSDKRASVQAMNFFEHTDYESWYMSTGNGFPPECYTVFKMMWYRDNWPELYHDTVTVLGTKDYCNFRMTGVAATDPSYASGSGVFDLLKRQYRQDLIDLAGLRRELFPEVIPSDDIVGTLTPEASLLLGLSPDVQVICGGVDNSCMALGAKGISEGRIYTSLGSSSWIAVTSKKPVLNEISHPYVFCHVVDGLYTSATSIFAAGSSLRWAAENLYQNREGIEPERVYNFMAEQASLSPVGANRLIFNPSLAGGSMIEESPLIKGGFMGLQLQHQQKDMLRAVYEGITMNLRYALEVLKKSQEISAEMLIVGGGSKSSFWRQMFADVCQLQIIKTNIDQSAASLGAAALAANGAGLWKGYEIIDSIHVIEHQEQPNHDNCVKYDALYTVFKTIMHHMAQAGCLLENLKL